MVEGRAFQTGISRSDSKPPRRHLAGRLLIVTANFAAVICVGLLGDGPDRTAFRYINTQTSIYPSNISKATTTIFGPSSHLLTHYAHPNSHLPRHRQPLHLHSRSRRGMHSWAPSHLHPPCRQRRRCRILLRQGVRRRRQPQDHTVCDTGLVALQEAQGQEDYHQG